MLKDKLMEDLKQSMKEKNVYKWLELQFYKLKKTKE